MKGFFFTKWTLVVLCVLIKTGIARAFTTANDGTIYNFEKLASIEGAGVSKIMEDNTICYLIENSDTIAANDVFKIDQGVMIKFAVKAELVILGEADLQTTAEYPTLLTATSDNTAKGISLCNEYGTTMSWINFEHVGFTTMSKGSIYADHCQFINHNGNAAAALFFTSAGTMATISDCVFERCFNAAIGSAANASQPMTITNCVFINNSTSNTNKPQINITAAEILIDNCKVIGDSSNISANNMVGGIGISNFVGYESNIKISNCQIMHNRYGIGTVGPTNIVVENNYIYHNNHESNPMNGGSGISFYDPYGQTMALVAQNHIEGNMWGITIIGCKDVNVGKPADSNVLSPGMNVFRNNGFNNQPYDLYNNSQNTIYAQNNTWSVEQQIEELIETVVYHQHDDSSLGEVIFMPAFDKSSRICSQRKNTEDKKVYDLNGRVFQNQNYKRNVQIVNGKKMVR